MDKYLFLLVLVGCSLRISGQNLADAARYGQNNYFGTARNTAVGSSMGALGGDFGVISQNPATTGVFRWSEFTFTPSLHYSSISSDLRGNATERSGSEFSMNNVGLVMVNRNPQGNFRTFNLAIGVNRLADFNFDAEFEGQATGSIADRYVEIANGLALEELDEFEALLAYDAGLIYDFEGDNFYENDYQLANGEPTNKRQSINSLGGMSELTISLGTNFQEKLLLGLSVGIPFVNYEMSRNYEESDDEDRIPFFENMEFVEFLQASGSGFTAKAGFIYLINKNIRIGGAFHLPTNIKIEETYTTDLTHEFTEDDNFQSLTELSPEGNFDYKYQSPMRALGSFGILFGKNGFISAEAEYIPYHTAKFKFEVDKEYENDLNSEITDEFTSVINLRGGAEYAHQKIRIRGGIQLLSSPYVDGDTFVPVYSGGFGFRGNSFFLDLTYQYTAKERAYSPYQVTEFTAPQVAEEDKTQLFMATLGFKF